MNDKNGGNFEEIDPSDIPPELRHMMGQILHNEFAINAADARRMTAPEFAAKHEAKVEDVDGAFQVTIDNVCYGWNKSDGSYLGWYKTLEDGRIIGERAMTLSLAGVGSEEEFDGLLKKSVEKAMGDQVYKAGRRAQHEADLKKHIEEIESFRAELLKKSDALIRSRKISVYVMAGCAVAITAAAIACLIITMVA